MPEPNFLIDEDSVNEQGKLERASGLERSLASSSMRALRVDGQDTDAAQNMTLAVEQRKYDADSFSDSDTSAISIEDISASIPYLMNMTSGEKKLYRCKGYQADERNVSASDGEWDLGDDGPNRNIFVKYHRKILGIELEQAGAKYEGLIKSSALGIQQRFTQQNDDYDVALNKQSEYLGRMSLRSNDWWDVDQRGAETSRNYLLAKESINKIRKLQLARFNMYVHVELMKHRGDSPSPLGSSPLLFDSPTHRHCVDPPVKPPLRQTSTMVKKNRSLDDDSMIMASADYSIAQPTTNDDLLNGCIAAALPKFQQDASKLWEDALNNRMTSAGFENIVLERSDPPTRIQSHTERRFGSNIGPIDNDITSFHYGIINNLDMQCLSQSDLESLLQLGGSDNGEIELIESSHLYHLRLRTEIRKYIKYTSQMFSEKQKDFMNLNTLVKHWNLKDKQKAPTVLPQQKSYPFNSSDKGDNKKDDMTGFAWNGNKDYDMIISAFFLRHERRESKLLHVHRIPSNGFLIDLVILNTVAISSLMEQMPSELYRWGGYMVYGSAFIMVYVIVVTILLMVEEAIGILAIRHVATDLFMGSVSKIENDTLQSNDTPKKGILRHPSRRKSAQKKGSLDGLRRISHKLFGLGNVRRKGSHERSSPKMLSCLTSVRHLFIGPSSRDPIRPCDRNIQGGTITGRVGHVLAWKYMMGEGNALFVTTSLTHLIALIKTVSVFMLAIIHFNDLIFSIILQERFDNKVNVFVDAECTMDHWYFDPDMEGAISEAMCFISSVSRQDTSGFLHNYWTEQLPFNHFPFHDASDSMSVDPKPITRHHILTNHKNAVSHYCGQLFGLWQKDESSFLHIAQSMVPQCYSELDTDKYQLTGYRPYEVDLHCVCSYLDKPRCAESQFCQYNWEMNTCGFSYYALSTEFYLQAKEQGHRQSPSDCPDILYPLKIHDEPIAEGDPVPPEVYCDVHDVMATRYLKTDQEPRQLYRNIGVISLYVFLAIGAMMSVRGKIFGYLHMFITMVYLILVISLGISLGCGGSKGSYPNQVKYFEDFEYIDSNSFITYRASAPFYGAEGPQGEILERNYLSGTDNFIGCQIGPTQEEGAYSLAIQAQLDRGLLTLLDHQFWANVIGYALLFSNIGTGMKIHHGSLRHTKMPSSLPGIITPLAILPPIYATVTHITTNALQLIGTNTYAAPIAAMNQDWWLKVEFPFDFHPMLSLIWTAGLWAVEMKANGTYYLCGESFTTSIFVLRLLIQSIKPLLCITECWTYLGHFVHGVLEVHPRLSNGAGYIEQEEKRGGTTYSGKAYQLTIIILLLMVALPIIELLDDNAMYVFYHFTVYNMMRFVLPWYVINLVINLAWICERNLASLVVGQSELRMKEYFFWVSLTITGILPVVIAEYGSVTDTTWPEQCPTGWYTCQPHRAYPITSGDDSERTTGFYCHSSWWFIWLIFFIFSIVNPLIWLVIIHQKAAAGGQSRRTTKAMHKIRYDAVVRLLTSPDEHLGHRDAESFTNEELDTMIGDDEEHGNYSGIDGLTNESRLWWLVCSQSRMSLMRLGILWKEDLKRQKVFVSEGLCLDIIASDFWSVENVCAVSFAYVIPTLMVFVMQQSVLEVIYLQIPWLESKSDATRGTPLQVLSLCIPVVLILFSCITHFSKKRCQRTRKSNRNYNE